MRQERRLARLLSTLRARVAKLDALNAAAYLNDTSEARRLCSFATIELQTSWTNFVRSFYLSSAYLSPKSLAGSTIRHSNSAVTDERSALILAIQTLRNTNFSVPVHEPISSRDEPDWKAKPILLNLDRAMGFSNGASILSALSYPANFFEELFPLRNFFAHRDHKGADRIRNLAWRRFRVRSIQHPSELLLRPVPNRSGSLFRSWAAEIVDVATLLCT
jgi:hypothetical protein